MLDLAAGLQLADLGAGRVDRDREADADVAAEDPPPVSIWELIPITLPEASISGPPELPGLIAASVWITFEIEKPLGAWIWRCSAETMPLVTVRSSPNGLPIATTGSPTWSWEECPSGSGWSWSAGASTLNSARSVAGSAPITRAVWVASEEPSLTWIRVAPETTWLLVRTWPSVSSTNPDPVAVPPPWGWPKGSNGEDDRAGWSASMKATPCPSWR